MMENFILFFAPSCPHRNKVHDDGKLSIESERGVLEPWVGEWESHRNKIKQNNFSDAKLFREGENFFSSCPL